jgi:hypothetical protein
MVLSACYFYFLFSNSLDSPDLVEAATSAHCVDDVSLAQVQENAEEQTLRELVDVV